MNPPQPSDVNPYEAPQSEDTARPRPSPRRLRRRDWRRQMIGGVALSGLLAVVAGIGFTAAWLLLSRSASARAAFGPREFAGAVASVAGAAATIAAVAFLLLAIKGGLEYALASRAAARRWRRFHHAAASRGAEGV